MNTKTTLHDLGGGLLYDSVLDMTWLQDASYVKTSGFKANGKLSWKAAVEWAHTLVYKDEVRGREITGWRLPRVYPTGANGKFNGRFSLDGLTDEGYNHGNPRSELGHMFYVNLGIKGYYSPFGEEQAKECGVARNGQRGWVVNVGLVKNLLSYIYWTETAAPPYVDRNAWMFDAQYGFQNFYNQNDMLCPWAVHDGNVAGLIPDVSSDAECDDTGRPVITLVAPPESRQELDTYTEVLGGVRCEFAFNNSIQPGPYQIMWHGMEKFVTTPDLVAFWIFGEKAGQARQSIISGLPYRLEEVGDVVERVEGGPFSGFAARFDGSRYLRLPKDRLGRMDIGGTETQVSMVASVFLEEIPHQGGIIAGLRGENGGLFRYVLRIDSTRIPKGKWITLGFASDGESTQVYLNGVPEHGESNCYLGSKAGAAGEFLVGEGHTLKGRLGGLAVFSRVLSADEMKRLHEAAGYQALNLPCT